MNQPPAGSRIRIEDTFEGRRIVIPKPRRKLDDIFGMAFLCFWICGWAVFEVLVVRAIWQPIQRLQFDGGFWFAIAWICVWSIGGLFAIIHVCNLVRGDPPEIITLRIHEITHHRECLRVYQKSEVDNVTIERSSGAHCLYFDVGVNRVYIGTHIREPEREWLFTIIKGWKEK